MSGVHAQADAVWKGCLASLEKRVPEVELSTWLRPLQPVFRGDRLVLLAPNAFVLEQVRDHFLPMLADAIQGVTLKLEIGTRPKAVDGHDAPPSPSPAQASPASVATRQPRQGPSPDSVEPAETPARKKPRATQQVGEKGHLPFIWGDATRALPSAYVRSGLFTVNRYGEGTARPRRDRALIASQKNISMYVTGEETNVFDRDVLMQLLQYQRRHPIGQRFCFSARQVLGDLGKPVNGRNISILIRSIERLHETHVRLEQLDPRGGRFGTFTLVTEFYRDESDGGNQQNWIISFNETVADLLGRDEQTRLIWGQSQMLRSLLAKWLHGYFASHAQPHAVTTSFLQKLTCSDIEELKRFRSAVKEALDELVEAKFLASWSYDKASDKFSVRRAVLVLDDFIAADDQG